MSDTGGSDAAGGRPADKRLSPKDRADVYVALAKSGQERFNVHHAVEWKIHFGLWTLFVAGAVLLIRYDSEWELTAPACIFLNILTVALLVVYCCWWLPHSHDYREECTRTRWWWEACALEELSKRPPPELKPRGWPVPSDNDPDKWSERGWVHDSQRMSVVVTVCFALLFLLAIWIKSDKPIGCPEGLHMGLFMVFMACIIGGLLVGCAIVSGAIYAMAYERCEEKFKRSEEERSSSGV